MAGSITTLGIGSSLDLQGILDGLREADEISITRKKNEVTELNATKDEFNVLNAKLLEMKTSARSLSLQSNWLKRTSSVSSDIITATVADGTEVGNHSVTVNRLASQSSFTSVGKAATTSTVHVPTIQKSETGFDDTDTTVVLAEGEDMSITYGYGDDRKIITVVGGVGGYTMDQLVTAIDTHTDNGGAAAYVDASTYTDSEGKHHLQIAATSGGTGETNRVMVTDPPDATNFAADAATFAYRVGSSGDTISLSVAADSTLAGLAEQINSDTNNPGVTASVINTGIGANPYQLVIKANSMGEDNRISIVTGLADLALTEGNGSGYIMESESTISFTNPLVIRQLDTNTDFIFQEDTGNGYSTDITATIPDSVFSKGSDLAAAVEKAMEDASAASGSSIDYTVTWNENTSKLEISEGGALTGLKMKWDDAGSTAASALGFSTEQILTPSTSSLNASVTVNDITYQRQSNSNLTDLVTGVTLSMSQTGSSTITIGQETDSMKSDITALVTLFNDIITEIDNNDDYDEDTETWGSLAKTSSVQTMKSTLLSLLGQTVDTGTVSSSATITSLYDLGFDIDEDGAVSINETTLDTALSGDFSGIKSFFLGTDDVTGMGELLNDHLRELTIGEGYIDSETDSIDEKISTLESTIESETERINKKYEALTQQFVQLDSYMREMESMQSYVGEMFSAMKTDDSK